MEASEATAFKKGSDLRREMNDGKAGTLTCVSCGGHTEQDSARDLGWKVRPPVCPDCLRWSVTDDEATTTSIITIRPRGRFWSVYERGILLCVTVYKRGATAVASRLAEEHRGSGYGRR